MLTGKQRRYLRGLGHPLRPVVQVGKDGIDAGLVVALDTALATHELVKVKLLENAELDRHAAAAELAKQTKSELAQVLGYTILLYRRRKDAPEIELPKGR